MDQPVTGIRNQRRSRIADQRYGLRGGQPQQVFAGRRTRVIVIADQLGFEPQVLEQLAGNPGIFTGYRNHSTEYRYRAGRNITQIANRGGNNIQTRFKQLFH